MNLTKFLRDQNYDLVEGPIRNHKPLQLWLKKTFDDIELYYASIDHAFQSTVALDVVEDSALNVNSNQKNVYGFNVGITLLEETLKSLGLGTFEISTKIKSGKKVTISYDNSMTNECAIGNIENYLSNADFKHPNPALLKNANHNNIIIITGAVFAKNLIVEIETDFVIDLGLVANLNAVAEGKLNFSLNSQSKIKMISSGMNFFPIAVKANRIDFDKGIFKKTTLITDSGSKF